MKKPQEEWITWAKHQNKQIYFYQDKVYDLTVFSLVHPGGKKALINYAYKDITKLLFTIYPHNSQSLQTLKRYKIGINSTFKDSISRNENSSKKSSMKGSCQKKKVCFRKTIDYCQDKKQNRPQTVFLSQKSASKTIQKQSEHQSNSNTKKSNSNIAKISQSVTMQTSHSEVSSLTKNMKLPLQMNWDQFTDIQEYEQANMVIKIPVFHVKHLNGI